MATQTLQEEQFILRIADPQLAERVRRALREEESLTEGLSLSFPESARQGVLTVDGVSHQVDLLDLPTVVESYKTYDDTNLVKTGDIGQVLLVGGQLKQGQVECEDGVTPPMRNARQRHFKQLPKVDPQFVARVEADLLRVLGGGAPVGFEYQDVEEEIVVDPKTGVGAWQQVKPAAPAAAAGDGAGPSGTTAAGAGAAAAGTPAAGGGTPGGTAEAKEGGAPPPKSRGRKGGAGGSAGAAGAVAAAAGAAAGTSGAG